jgi:hypothetical protein|eukprot:COSAG06_NODE_60_length_27159_cov_57.986031_9_plen_59_part_00
MAQKVALLYQPPKYPVGHLAMNCGAAASEKNVASVPSCKKTRYSFLSAFPMFVPSLSW